MTPYRLIPFLVPFAVFIASAAPGRAQSSHPALTPAAEDLSIEWSRSAPAQFLTKQERKSWKTLRTDAERQAFERAYWQRRDPDPATAQNEFKAVIDLRVAKADERFATAGRRGSETARGRAFVLLGPAAVEEQTVGPLDTSPQYYSPTQGYLPPGALERREWQTWIYNERNPDVVRATKLTTFELTFAVDGSRRDSLQSAARFASIREAMAEASVHSTPANGTQ